MEEAKEALIYSVRPELVEGQKAHHCGLRQAQPERSGMIQRFQKVEDAV